MSEGGYAYTLADAAVAVDYALWVGVIQRGGELQGGFDGSAVAGAVVEVPGFGSGVGGDDGFRARVGRW